MKWVLLFLFFSVVAASLGLCYLLPPGNITITWLNYEIQFSILFGFINLVVLFFAGFMFSFLLCWMRSSIRYCADLFKFKDNKENGSGVH